jgi:putative tricarboxylic transport membrane protein
MRRLNSDTLIAVFLLLVCGVLFHDTFFFRETPLAIVTSDVWPRIVLVLLFIFSAVFLFQSVRADADTEEGKSLGPVAWIMANRNVLWCYGLFALFLLTLPWLGMLIGGGLFVFATLTAMGRNQLRSHAVNAVIAVLSMGIMWAIFTFGLRVMLPEGEILRIF